MEANTCDDNHVDANVLLPPRKRLLACMKKQSGDRNVVSNPPSTSTSTNHYDIRINNLLSAHLRVENPSQEEIVEASRSAAEVALKIAITARAAAEKKALKATMAMAAAKKALELVAALEAKQPQNNNQETNFHVQTLYNNKKLRAENDKKSDEELARQLHQAINSSPRISKHEHRKLKIPNISEACKTNNEDNSPSVINTSKLIRDRVACIVNVDHIPSKVNEADLSKMENGVKFCEEDTSIIGRKRGRMKQKKLPLSICHNRDQLNPKEDRKCRSSDLVDEIIGEKTLLSVGSSTNNSMLPIERNSLWKYQAFKSAARLKQNKAMES